LETLEKLNHPNIVRLLGIYFDKNSYYIVTEFVKLGSLSDVLDSEKMTFSQLMKIALQVCCGMRYLESNQIVHRDLAVRNILVSKEGEDYIAKISDFGLARSDNYYTQLGSTSELPIRWCSIEVFSKGKHSSKSDVWSFGVLLWEMVSGGIIPYTGRSLLEVVEYVTGGGRLPKPKDCPDELYNIMLLCWKDSPKDRPSFEDLYKIIEKVVPNGGSINSSSPNQYQKVTNR